MLRLATHGEPFQRGLQQGRAARALALMAGGSGELLRLSAEPILKEALPQSDG